MTAPVWLAELDTRHYSFRAVGSTRDKALAALSAVLERHAADRALEAGWWDPADANVYEMTVDAPGTRDGMEVAP